MSLSLPSNICIGGGALAVALITACGSPSEPATPEPPTELVAGDTATGVVVAGDTARFALTADPGYHQVRLRALSGSAADTLEVRVILDNGNVLTTLRSAGTDTALTVSRSSWYLYGSSFWRLEVRRVSGSNGNFALKVAKVDNNPEILPRRVPVNTVLNEALDVPDDVDEYEFTGSAGDEIIIFARGHGVPKLRMFTGGRDSLLIDHNVQGFGEATPNLEMLEQESSGRVWLPYTGTYVIVVDGDLAGPAAYAFKIMNVATAPEEGAAAIAPGTVAAGEIAPTGDADEFTLTGTASQEVNLAVQLESGFTFGGLTVELRQGTQVVRRVDVSQPGTSIDDMGSGRFALPVSGTYTIRVVGADRKHEGTATGRYKVELYPVSRGVENAATVGVNQAPSGSAIDRAGDVDEFTVNGTAGVLAMMDFNATVTTPNGVGLRAQLLAADGTPVATAESEYRYSRRTPLPYTGTYTLRVQATEPAGLARGPYTLELYTVSPAPETISATVLVGDTITGERIDRPGDLDEFTFAGDAGRDVNIFLAWLTPNGAVYGLLPQLSAWFPSAGPQLDTYSSGRFRLDAGSYTLRIDPHFAVGTADHDMAGDYSFVVYPLNRAPEVRSAAYVVGDTLSTEVLYPAGDVDEFTWSVATAGDFKVFWEGSEAVNGLRADIHDNAGTLVWSSFNRINFTYIPEVSLPAGQYRLSVFAHNVVPGIDPFMAKLATQPFRFALTPK